jgi:transposase
MEDARGSGLLRVTHVHVGGKREFDAVSKARLVQACLAPGVSVSKLALENGVNANLLRTWIRKHRGSKGSGGREGSRPLEGSPFIPVIEARARLAEGSAENPSALIAPQAERERRDPHVRDNNTEAGVRATISLPNGVKLSLEFTDASVMAAMIGALGDVPFVG